MGLKKNHGGEFRGKLNFKHS